MIEQISSFFTNEMVFYWLNFGILPFWISLIFFPQSRFCQYIVTSFFPFLILSGVYSYLFYIYLISGFNFSGNFNLYMGLDNLKRLYNETPFLLLFWIHFLGVNLFCGCWIVKDSQKFTISKYILFFPLILTYFVGPIGILIYWLIKVVRANKINLFE